MAQRKKKAEETQAETAPAVESVATEAAPSVELSKWRCACCGWQYQGPACPHCGNKELVQAG